MSITVSAVKARQNLGELLNLVSIKNEEVIIERAGKKMARLIAIDDKVRSVNEPAAETYSIRKKPAQKKDNSRNVHGTGVKAPPADIPEGAVPQQPDIIDLCGLGKEMWKNTGLTPDEYVRKEREEWD